MDSSRTLTVRGDDCWPAEYPRARKDFDLKIKVSYFLGSVAESHRLLLAIFPNNHLPFRQNLLLALRVSRTETERPAKPVPSAENQNEPYRRQRRVRPRRGRPSGHRARAADCRSDQEQRNIHLPGVVGRLADRASLGRDAVGQHDRRRRGTSPLSLQNSANSGTESATGMLRIVPRNGRLPDGRRVIHPGPFSPNAVSSPGDGTSRCSDLEARPATARILPSAGLRQVPARGIRNGRALQVL
jgi:hypothetical protein